MILDVMMPFMDGMTCLREMRARHINTPVIILTARGEEYDNALKAGVDLNLGIEKETLFWSQTQWNCCV